jgi:hypothetical protein
MVNLVAISIKENESVRDVLKQSSASYKRLSKDEGLCRDRGEKGTLECEQHAYFSLKLSQEFSEE